jgi:hypothetical protein
MKQLYLFFFLFPVFLIGQESESSDIVRFGVLLYPEMTNVQFDQMANINRSADLGVGISLGGQVQVMMGKGMSLRLSVLKGERQYQITESGTGLSYSETPATEFYADRAISIESFDFQVALGYEFGNDRSLWSVHAGIAYHIFENAQVEQHSRSIAAGIRTEEMTNHSVALQDNGNISGVFSISYARFLGKSFAAFIEPQAYVNLQPIGIETMEGYRFMGAGLSIGLRYFVGKS